MNVTKLSHDILLSSRPLKQVKNITNGLIIELLCLRTIHRLPWRTVVGKVIQLYGKKWPCDGPSELTMIITLSTTYKRHRTLVLKRNASINLQFENCQFSIPVSRLTYKSKVAGHPPRCKRKSLLRKEYQSVLKSTNTGLCNELKMTETEVIRLKKKLSKTTANMYNVNRREKRKGAN